MDRTEIAKRVRHELEGLLKAPADFAETDQVADHGLDSLTSVQLTLNLEDAFEIVFDDDEISYQNFATIKGIVDLIEAKLASA